MNADETREGRLPARNYQGKTSADCRAFSPLLPATPRNMGHLHGEAVLRQGVTIFCFGTVGHDASQWASVRSVFR